MKEVIEEYDVVSLTEYLPELNLKKGERGTIVLVLAPDIVEVEFCDAGRRSARRRQRRSGLGNPL